MEHLIPIYKYSIGNQFQFGAYLNGMTFNIDYPTLGEIFNAISTVLAEDMDDPHFHPTSLKIFYHHPQDPAHFYFWDKNTKVSFEDKLVQSDGESILNSEPVFIITLQDAHSWPPIFWEKD